MARFIKLLFFILTPIISFSQLKFQEISFADALRVSKEAGRLIFLQIESPTCKQCNDVANKAFENEELSSSLTQTFVCLRITPDHPDRKIINSLYNLENKFGSIFIDHDKTLIHSFNKTTTRASEYKDQISLALNAAGESLRISELEKEYKKGNKAAWLMEQLLLKRKALNLDTDTLLDEYITGLSEDSLRSVKVLLFIAQMAPVIGSNADNKFRKNFELFSKAWYSMSLPERVNINNRIISKSKQKAIREKNEAYAYRLANFARSINSNTQAAAKASELILLDFYQQTNDTTKYFITAVDYYDRYFMTINPDTIKKRDSLNRLKLLSQTTGQMVSKKGDTSVFQKTIQYAPMTQIFTRDLNNGAWNFYTMTNNSVLLQSALQWSKRANDFFENPEAMDTYSRLLYKMGDKEAAVDWQTRAIALRKKRGFETSEYENILAGMKKNKERIDEY